MMKKQNSILQEISYAGVQDIPFIIGGLNEICRLENETPDTDSSMIRDTKNAILKKEIRVLKVNGESVGFSQHKITKECPYGFDFGKYKRKYCWIDWMFVDQKQRGRGLGGVLHDDIKSICKKKNITEIMLDVFHVNEHARKFYEKEKFKEHIHILKEEI